MIGPSDRFRGINVQRSREPRWREIAEHDGHHVGKRSDPRRRHDVVAGTAEAEALEDTPGSWNGLEGKLDMQGFCHGAGLVGAIS